MIDVLAVARRRAARVAGSVVLVAAAALALAPAAAAEQINDITVQVTVDPDTSFSVIETIRYDFEGEYRHGIFRNIPVQDVQPDGSNREYGVDVRSVTMDGQPVPYQLFDESPFLQVKIGDPDVTITGEHTYVIAYRVSNGLTPVTQAELSSPQAPPGVSAGDVALYWDLVGDAWEVPIARASSTVSGPADVVGALCFTGAAGSTATCPVTVSGSTATFGPVSLGAYQALTGSTVFPAGAFTAQPTVVISQPPPNPLLGVAGGLIPAALFIIIPVVVANARKREDAGVVLDGAPPQYSPPDSLPAAAMLAAYDGAPASARPRMLVATLVDLAARRWINLSSADGSLKVEWLGTGTTPMSPWEEALVGAILHGQSTAVMDGYDESVATTWSTSVSTLVTDGESSGRRNPAGDAPDRRWRFLAVIAVILLALGFGSLVVGVDIATAALFTIGAGALVGFIAATAITPRKETEQSAQFRAKVRGLQKVLGTDAAESRREFAQKLGLPPAAVFATMLPYAIVFNLQDSWIGAYPDLTPDDLQNYGFYYVGWGSMSGLLDAGNQAVHSAMTAPSSSSGGSGLSGGFSGGGGGGGGGGSW